MSILLSNKGIKDAQDQVFIVLGLGHFALIACYTPIMPKGETQETGFQGVSLYVLCCFFCSIVRGRFFCDRSVFRRCYMRYYISLSSYHGNTRCYTFSVLRCYMLHNNIAYPIV